MEILIGPDITQLSIPGTTIYRREGAPLKVPNIYKGRMAPSKRMNFRKISKRPLTPPSFSENYIA